MKLTFNSPTLDRASITNPRTSPVLCVAFQTPFNKQLAKRLGLEDVLYDKKGVIRTFPYHGVKIKLAEASIDFTRPATPSGKEGKTSTLSGEVHVEKVTQEEIKDGLVTMLSFKTLFSAKHKTPAFDMLLGWDGPGEWQSISVSGSQQALFEEPQAEGEGESEPAA